MIPLWAWLIVATLGVSGASAMVVATRWRLTNWFWFWLVLLLFHFSSLARCVEAILKGGRI